MKHFIRTLLVIWSICTFGLVLWLSLVPMINSSSFFQNVWRSENIYEKINMSEEELTKVINHTMDYMWDKEDSLQIQVTLNSGEVVDFYQNWGIDSYTGLEMDELGHMADCKVLFMTGKRAAQVCLVLFTITTGLLIFFRKHLTPKIINTTYLTYGGILVVALIFGIACLIDFDAMFIGFHKLFFSNTTYSWSYPWRSRMIIMLPEDAIFENIVIRTLINFFLIFSIIIAGSILLQKKVLKRPNQTSKDQQI